MSLKLNQKIEVRVSDIEGKGLFAKESFSKGDVFKIVSGEGSYKDMTDDEFGEYKKTVDNWDAVSLGNGKYRVSLLSRDEDPSNFGNHSCDPNIAPKDDHVIALRDINPDEELTIDYAQFSEKDWQMECNCKSPNCKKLIKGNL